MKIFDQLGIEVEMVVFISLFVMLLLLILVIALFVKNSKLNKRYKAFMEGSDGTSLESIILDRFTQIDKIQGQLLRQDNHLKQIDETLLKTFQKIGIVKYDAFKEMGGKLSFAVALLNAENDGIIVNSMHSSREGCYSYVKEVIKGEAFVVLSNEEQEALSQAIKCNELIK